MDFFFINSLKYLLITFSAYICSIHLVCWYPPSITFTSSITNAKLWKSKIRTFNYYMVWNMYKICV